MGDVRRLEWLAENADYVARAFTAKFMRGRSEHQSDIGTLTIPKLLEEMEQEALDQLSYVRELKRRFALDTLIVNKNHYGQ